MLFASFKSTTQKTNPWYFHKKCWELVILKNSFLFIRPFWIFCFIPMKISPRLFVRMDGTQSLWLWWFKAKNHSPQTFQQKQVKILFSSCFFFRFCVYSKRHEALEARLRVFCMTDDKEEKTLEGQVIKLILKKKLKGGNE